MLVRLMDDFRNNNTWLEKIYSAYRRCYSSDIVIRPESKEKMLEFIKKHKNHESPLEHVLITVHIQGVSRSLTHQLVRHRIASYSQMSQRYTKNNFDFIIPPSIKNNEEAKILFVEQMEKANETYKKLNELGIPNEDSRYVFPNATETRIVVSMNIRSWKHFFNERCCTKAQWEIRNLANEILRLFRENIPVIFDDAGPKCQKYNVCLENEPCGRLL